MTKFEVGKTYKTRDGRDARVICVDYREQYNYSIVALVTSPSTGSEDIVCYKPDGKVSALKKDTKDDLLLPAPKVWVVAAVEDGECKDAFHVYRENYVDEFRELLTRQFPNTAIITKEVDLTEDKA